MQKGSLLQRIMGLSIPHVKEEEEMMMLANGDPMLMNGRKVRTDSSKYAGRLATDTALVSGWKGCVAEFKNVPCLKCSSVCFLCCVPQ